MLDRGGYATLRAVADHFLYWLSHDVAELETLRDRLRVLEQTGSVPRHPAEIYDDDVLKALERTFPGGVYHNFPFSL